MRAIIVLVLSVLTLFPLYSQRDQTILKNPGIKFTGIWAGSLNRMHNFTGDSHYSNGGYFTLEFNKDYLIGWDGYTVNASNDQYGDINISTSGLHLGYARSGYSVIHPTATLSLGKARARADEQTTLNTFAAHGAIGAEFNIFRWFRIGGEVGYRYIDDGGDTWLSDTSLSAPYAGIKLKFGWSWGR